MPETHLLHWSLQIDCPSVRQITLANDNYEKNSPRAPSICKQALRHLIYFWPEERNLKHELKVFGSHHFLLGSEFSCPAVDKPGTWNIPEQFLDILEHGIITTIMTKICKIIFSKVIKHKNKLVGAFHPPKIPGGERMEQTFSGISFRNFGCTSRGWPKNYSGKSE